MRQDQSFPAQVELLLYDKPVRLWRLISENETKCSNFEQNWSTKSQKAAGVRIEDLRTIANGMTFVQVDASVVGDGFESVAGSVVASVAVEKVAPVIGVGNGSGSETKLRQKELDLWLEMELGLSLMLRLEYGVGNGVG